MSVKKIERILNLVSYLLKTNEPVPWSEIAGNVIGYDDDVSERSLERRFERDKAYLKKLGIPIRYCPPGEKGGEGYVIAKDGCFLGRIELLPHEIMLLNLIGGEFSKTATGEVRKDLGSAIRKLRFDYPETFHGEEVGFEPGPSLLDASEDAERIEVLSEAILRNKRVTFDYFGTRDSGPRTRTIRPYGLGFRDGAWRLVGHCEERDAIRNFVVSRMTSPVRWVRDNDVSDFEIPGDFELGDHISRRTWDMTPDDGRSCKVTARLLLEPDLAWLLCESLDRYRIIEEHPTGAFEVELDIRSETGFFMWYMRHLRHVRLLGPEDLVQSLAAHVEKIQGLYEVRV